MVPYIILSRECYSFVVLATVAIPQKFEPMPSLAEPLTRNSTWYGTFPCVKEAKRQVFHRTFRSILICRHGAFLLSTLQGRPVT